MIRNVAALCLPHLLVELFPNIPSRAEKPTSLGNLLVPKDCVFSTNLIVRTKPLSKPIVNLGLMGK